MDSSYELRHLSSADIDAVEPYVNRTRNSSRHDADVLAHMGKAQVLKRNFGFLSMFGFSCTILVTWEALLALSTETFINGGPSGIVYGFIISWVGTLPVYNVIAELASMASIACGQYFWVSILAPPSSRRFLSYATGWLTTIAWISTLATGAFVQGTMIQGLIILNHLDYVPQPWHGILLSWAVVLIAILINTVVSSLLPKIEGAILIVHVLGFFGIIVPMICLSPHASTSDVFNTFINGGNWSTQGVSFCVGLTGMVASFVGSDAAVHMSEEILNPALNVPRAIFTTTILNGALGFGMIIALLFCIGDVDAALNSPTGYPYIQIFVQSTSSVAGGTAMAALVIGLSICATIGFLASASRMTWAFARDKGLPFSHILSRVERRTTVPVAAILVVSMTPILLTLINIGSSTVFNDVISLSVNGFYLSYLVPAVLLLWRRVTGAIRPMGPHETSQSHSTLKFPSTQAVANSDGVLLDVPMIWGPWKIPGIVGILNNAFAIVWMVFVIFWGFWPSEYPVTPQNMNYAIVVTGGTIVLRLVYYALYGRLAYKGPLVEI